MADNGLVPSGRGGSVTSPALQAVTRIAAKTRNVRACMVYLRASQENRTPALGARMTGWCEAPQHSGHFWKRIGSSSPNLIAMPVWHGIEIRTAVAKVYLEPVSPPFRLRTSERSFCVPLPGPIAWRGDFW